MLRLRAMTPPIPVVHAKRLKLRGVHPDAHILQVVVEPDPDHNSAAGGTARRPCRGQHRRTDEVKDQKLEVKIQRDEQQTGQ